MQHPIMTGHNGSEEVEPELWAAQAQVDIAVLIQRYLAENPPPGPSQTHRDFRLWATNLQLDFGITSGSLREDATKRKKPA